MRAPTWTPPSGPSDPPFPRLHDRWWKGARPESTFPVPFSVADGFILAVWSLVGALVLTQILALIYLLAVDVTDIDVQAVVMLALVGQVAATFGVFVYLRWRNRLSWRLLGPVRPRIGHLTTGLLIGLGAFLVVQLPMGYLAEEFGIEGPEQTLLEAFRAGGAVATMVIIMAVVVAPVIEEVVFRGVLFQALRRRIGLWPGAIVSALVFAMIHIEVVTVDALLPVLLAVTAFVVALLPRVALALRAGLVLAGFAALVWTATTIGMGPVLFPGSLAVLGVLLALAFHRTGSLLVPILGHAAFNGVALALAYYAETAPTP
jgi:uncharacterized protein